MDSIFFPVFDTNHWYLIVAKPSERKITCYDPLGIQRLPRLRDVNRFFREEANAKGLAFDDFALETGDCPMQKNNYDCGVYVCLIAHLLSMKVRIDKLKALSSSTLRRYLMDVLPWEIVDEPTTEKAVPQESILKQDGLSNPFTADHNLIGNLDFSGLLDLSHLTRIENRESFFEEIPMLADEDYDDILSCLDPGLSSGSNLPINTGDPPVCPPDDSSLHYSQDLLVVKRVRRPRRRVLIDGEWKRVHRKYAHLYSS